MLYVICFTGDSELWIEGNRGAFSLPAFATFPGVRADRAAETSATACRDGIASAGITSGEPVGGFAGRSEGAALDSD